MAKLDILIRSWFFKSFLFCMSFLGSIQTVSADVSKLLHFYNWSDYIASSTLTNFEKRTGIKVIYDVFDSNEMLDGKLMAGNIGFDLVVPSDNFLARQLHYHIYQPIDKRRLSNYNNLDKTFLKLLQIHDPGNRFGIPFMWQTTGIGINKTKIKEMLGEDVLLNSWDLLFKVENIKKLHQCGVAFLDAPTEIYPTVLNYLGKTTNNASKADYDQATQLLLDIRPYITYFHSSKYINDLASGDICIAVGWSGDVLQAKRAAKNAHKKFDIDYLIPKEGALISFDLLAIPKDAKNINEVYQFINYLLEPKVIAEISNDIFYPDANIKSKSFLKSDIINNKTIYPSQRTLKRLFPVTELTPDRDRYLVRLWTKVLTGD